MTKINRMNRSASSRATLRELERKNILCRERIGVRHVIRANTGLIEAIGLNVDALHGSVRDDPTFEHFKFVWPREAWVEFNGGRARLTGVQAHSWIDPSRLRDVPVNRGATELVRKSSTKGNTFDADADVLGDAILVTDHREHCVLQPSCRNCTPDDLSFFGSMLSTPNSLLERWGRSYILFHEEPREHDIIAIKLRWS
ncbi:hypothetical protein [Bosea sp. CRIB-10]|uniref:hypothetical protein n=1 Tax=Bosea sp. CRIB-10 TaxID=378404 RepID=UPI0011145AE1|nr:hypothetical protein [Bosea sp. CRIB-10]